MKKIFFSVSIVIVFLLSSFSQVIGQDLADIAFYRSQDLRVKLGLNIEQTQKMESTLLHFGEEYKKMNAAEYDENETFQEKYDQLKQEREKELKTFLDARQLQLFNVIQDQRIQYFKDFYESTSQQLGNNAAFTQELASYNQNVMLPELLRFRAKLDLKINQEDSLKLIEYSRVFDEILDDILAEENLAQFTSSSNIEKSLKKYSRKDPETKKAFKGIKKMFKKYDEPINDIAKEIDPLEVEWRKNITKIVTKYLPEEEREEYSNILNLLGTYGISQKIDPMVFLLFDPSNENSYFQLKRKLYRIFFKDLT